MAYENERVYIIFKLESFYGILFFSLNQNFMKLFATKATFAFWFSNFEYASSPILQKLFVVNSWTQGKSAWLFWPLPSSTEHSFLIYPNFKIKPQQSELICVFLFSASQIGTPLRVFHCLQSVQPNLFVLCSVHLNFPL